MKIIVIGSGLGSLTTACLLAKDGHEVIVLEQNYLPGGCTSSYYRQGAIFEAGATTVVGMEPDMPLGHLLNSIGITIDAIKLEVPMKVYLKDNTIITRHQNFDNWLEETKQVFGQAEKQEKFWTECQKISQFVWKNSLVQRTFPPSKIKDIVPIIKNFSLNQVSNALRAFTSTKKLLKKHGLHKNQRFIDFINEQLLITAQNQIEEVNSLFGATALCYTNSPNYYVFGGLMQLVRPLCEYIESKGGKVLLKTAVEKIEKAKNYTIHTNKGIFEADSIVSGIPINNIVELWESDKLQNKYKKKIMASEKLNSAFQMGIIAKRSQLTPTDCLHHQIHLPTPLVETNSHSIFLSLSHPQDWYRAPLDQVVMSISTHVAHPKAHQKLDKEKIEAAVIQTLVERNLVRKEDIIYQHSSTPSSWKSWTNRAFGFVGGYPQFMKIKPWQMLDARLDGDKAYLCGDTAYPGQGIPGVCLSGIIAYEKMKLDGVRALPS